MGKKALVTGASRGIGRAIAKRLAQAGYDLILTCHRAEDELNAFAVTLRDDCPVDVKTFTGDLADYAVCENLFSGVDDLDLLINNAGISHTGLLSDLTSDEWERIVGVNLSAPLYCSKLSVPIFLRKKAGVIINISSVWGEVGASMEVAYSATKGGLNAFTKALAKELAPSNIRVNAVSCGLIDTRMNAHLSEEEMQELIGEIPANRIGKPEDVADLVLQLAQSNTYLTGQVIRLDGGWI
ncbi:MAG: SDR family NAD(P)-dependent oxidoreductase [Lachnospiraceae bacterium]|nr:SDR family NAD(P)-dependent oxidoreductase [Lachnospiraceae bacterium]